MDAHNFLTQYESGGFDPEKYTRLSQIRNEFFRQRSAIEKTLKAGTLGGWSRYDISKEVGKLLEPLLDKYLPELEKLFGNQNIADFMADEWIREITNFPEQQKRVNPVFSPKYLTRIELGSYNYRKEIGQEASRKLRGIANLSIQPAPPKQQPQQPQQPTVDLQNWELPEEGLLQTGEFATQLAKQRQQQDANLMASGLTRQQILQQRGSENIVRELGLSKMIAEQRRKAIENWLQTVGGLQQQVRPPDFAGLREMASAFQQGTSAQQQMMMKVFENLMRQGG